MPLFYQHNINLDTRVGVWHIMEDESFFLERVSLQRPIKHLHKRLQHLAGRYLLQVLFADFPGHLIEIADTRKPFLPDEQFHFSISHCGDYAAAIVSRFNRVGVDIEIPREKVHKIAHKFVHESERPFITQNAPQLSETNLLTLIWSAKEAVYKWSGDGGVDFKEHINFLPQVIAAPSGTFDGFFIKNLKLSLQMNYHFFTEAILVWVSTDP